MAGAAAGRGGGRPGAGVPAGEPPGGQARLCGAAGGRRGRQAPGRRARRPARAPHRARPRPARPRASTGLGFSLLRGRGRLVLERAALCRTRVVFLLNWGMGPWFFRVVGRLDVWTAWQGSLLLCALALAAFRLLRARQALPSLPRRPDHHGSLHRQRCEQVASCAPRLCHCARRRLSPKEALRHPFIKGDKDGKR